MHTEGRDKTEPRQIFKKKKHFNKNAIRVTHKIRVPQAIFPNSLEMKIKYYITTGYYYHTVSVISFYLSQSYHIKWLTLYKQNKLLSTTLPHSRLHR
jgi:hypothetical protein